MTKAKFSLETPKIGDYILLREAAKKFLHHQWSDTYEEGVKAGPLKKNDF